MSRSAKYPRGAHLTDRELESDLHGSLARLRASEPVSWVPALGAWLVTGRDPAVEAMRRPDDFTVDDPRFSTAQVLGPSMLSLDGPEHARHRDPFAPAFRLPEVRRRLTERIDEIAVALVEDLVPRHGMEVRTELAGPLAAQVMGEILSLVDVDPVDLRAWYDEIVDAVTVASDGEVREQELPLGVDRLARGVQRTVERASGLLSSVADELSLEEIVSNAGVLLFGGIETSEGMTANVFAHLLAEPQHWRDVLDEPALAANAIEESLRLEPAVVRIDRFARRDCMLGRAEIGEGDFVMISLAAANRDPAVFTDPDRYDLRRSNAKQHVAFVHGPHACLGMHVARLETHAALRTAMARLPGLRLDPAARPPDPAGTVFRKPDQLWVVWD